MADNARLKRERLFDLYRQNLALYDKAAGDLFVCPLCRGMYPRAALTADPPLLTLAHIVPEKQGGKTCTLACAVCNNSVGHRLESVLLSQFRQEDWVAGVGTVDGTMETSAGRITVEMHFSEPGRGWNLKAIPERSDPAQVRAVEELMKSQREQKQADFQFSLKWRGLNSPLRVRAALYQSAYLLLFSHFGYEVLLRPHYDALRQWLLNPVEGGWPHNIQVISEETSKRLLSSGHHALLFVPKSRTIMAVLKLTPEDGRTRLLGVVLPGPFSPSIEEFHAKNFDCKIVPYQADALRECDWYLGRVWAEFVEEKALSG